MTNLFRSLVFVPGNNPRFLEKAKTISADIVCFDLEDSVPEKEKSKARKLIKTALAQRKHYLPNVYVRTNSPESGKIELDLKEIIQKGVDGVVIPKVNSAKELKKIEKTIISLEKKAKISGTRIIPSIESALGVVNCYEIASYSKRIDAIVFGIFDLLNDMGIEYTKGNPLGAKYSRYKIPVVATAAGVYAIDGIWQDVKDKSGLRKDCKIGRSLGYVGKSVIHPDQVETVHKIFHPNKTEIAWAKLVVKTYNNSTKKGKGATVVDNKMIDEVHYKRAKALLDVCK
uniref:Citryl-CoA lyase (CitE) n=1 Tax=uncultured marine thaumarchaeote KM3_203_A01 TaxID=1456097 RepID=A0A075GYZ4_9ARCH|nr:Citryl-CoA lyase (citE) [uncultured marine thaumarchaeote KM3_203_A01]